MQSAVSDVVRVTSTLHSLFNEELGFHYVYSPYIEGTDKEVTHTLHSMCRDATGATLDSITTMHSAPTPNLLQARIFNPILVTVLFTI